MKDRTWEDQMNRNGQLRALAILAVAAMLGACNRGDRETAMAEMDSAFDTAKARVDTAVGRLGGREYSDAELTGFVNTFNDAEVEVGQLATTKATDAQVKAFASTIVRDHRALKTDVNRTVQQLNLTPTVPDDDENLSEDHQTAMRDLRAKAKGAEWDEAFLEHEIRMHRKVLDEVKDAIGRSQSADMRTLLEKARDGIQGHLTTAEELEKKFGA
jgi:putative membrane protein